MLHVRCGIIGNTIDTTIDSSNCITVPVSRDAELAVPAPGLRGCVLGLTLGERDIDLFGEAVTGQDVIECDSAICSEQPCHNGGVCNQVSSPVPLTLF
jgi:hypothetical protein